MIDAGEKKQIYGPPKITIGALTQGFTAIFLAVFVFSFFNPEFSAQYLAQCNNALPGKFWTLLSGAVVFPESLLDYNEVPAGFWMIEVFFFCFFFYRPLERALPGWRGWLFVCAFMAGPGAVLYAAAPHALEYTASWPFAFYAAAGGAAAFRRTFKVKRIPEIWLYAAIPAVALIHSAIRGEWLRAVLTVLCFAFGFAIIFFKKGSVSHTGR